MTGVLRTAIFAALTYTVAVGFAGFASAQTPPKVITASPTGVNMLEGAFTTSATDLAIGPLQLERSYLGGTETSSGPFGANWTHNYDIWVTWHNASLSHPDSTTTVVIGRQKFVYYGLPASAIPMSEDDDTSLKVINNNYVFTNRNGVVYTIGQSGGNINISYPQGLKIDITRVNGLTKLISTNIGAAIIFDYSGSTISAACAFDLAQTYVSTATTCASASLKTSYQYTNGNLTGATNVMGDTAHYSYGAYGSQELTCLTDPGSATCKINNYYATGHKNVDHQVLADGSTWYFSCSCSGTAGRSDADNDFPDDDASWTDPSGHSMSFYYHGYSLISYFDQLGRQYLTSYYGKYLTSVTSPEGNQTLFLSRDSDFPSYKFVAKPGSNLAAITQGAQTFPAQPCANVVTCYLPLTYADAKGNVTDYVWDQTHGGMLSEMKPAPSLNQARPLTLRTYVQKYAYIKNSAGSLVPASSPMWLVQSETQCQTVAGASPPAICDNAAQKTVTTYEYGADGTPDNLLVRGTVVTADGVSLRTCMSYDGYGRKVSETSARAGLAVCQ